jgi:hypothetical protein
MLKRQRLNTAISTALSRLAIYWNLALWRAIWQQSQRYRWRSITAEVAFLWVLGLLGASFALLQFSQQPYFKVPTGALQLASRVQQILAIPTPTEPGQSLGLLWLLAVVFGAALCFVTGTERLTYALATIYQGAPSRRPGWAGKLWPWFLTIIMVLIVGLISRLVGPIGTVANASAPSTWLSWPGVTQLLRWLVSVGLVGLGVGLVHRLSPRQWPPGCPLWLGTGLTVGLGLGVFGLGRWGATWVQTQALAYGLFLSLSLALISLFAWLWLVLAGAQFNVSAMSNHGGPGQTAWKGRATPPPPSFESFKINR